jgi:hypothetical protein
MARSPAGEDALAGPRFVLCLHGEPRDTHLLHDLSADSVLVRVY